MPLYYRGKVWSTMPESNRRLQLGRLAHNRSVNGALVDLLGIDPSTSVESGRRSTNELEVYVIWHPRRDSNLLSGVLILAGLLGLEPKIQAS